MHVVRLQGTIVLLLISQAIIEDQVIKVEETNAFGLLADEVTDISNVCQLVTVAKYFDLEKSKANIVFIYSSDLLNYSPEGSPDANAIGSCIT